MIKNYGLTDLFSSSSTEMSFHFLMALIVSNEKSAVIHMIIFLYMFSSFGCFQDFLFIVTFQNMIVIYSCVVFIVFISFGVC